jgi:nucleoside phosphorylase
LTNEIAIFAALGWERRAVMAGLSEVSAEGPGRWRGSLRDGTSCIVVQTGVGPRRAREEAMKTPPVSAFVACGCAGALVDWLRPGDLVVADSIVTLDPDGKPAVRLHAAAHPLAAWAAGRGLRLQVGPVLASAEVLATQEAKGAASTAGAFVVEMESGALAAEAHARGIPFVAVRVVLDGLALTIPPELAAVDEATGELRLGRTVLGLLARPQLWPVARRLARHSRVAERRLRTFMIALSLLGGMRALAGPDPVQAAAH